MSAIAVENISKKFRIPHHKKTTLFQHAISFFKRQTTYEEFFALKDVSFEVKGGESFGIIGSNGSGKSTLLKLLARVMYPDSGTMIVNGKVASFLELGVGFQPELSARENVYIYSSILGMSHSETNRVYDEIFDFEKTFVEQGYEGCIVRNWDGEYLFGHRSSDIQKVKSFQDAEYKVVDFEHGVGKMANSAIWICETKDHKRFKATPKASAAKREEYYRDGKKYIGKLVKVAFQNLTADGIPRFPRALGFRDKKDM